MQLLNLQFYIKCGIIISDVGITLHNNLFLNGQCICQVQKGGKVLLWRSITTLSSTPTASSWVALVPIRPGEPISSACSRILFLTSIRRFLTGLLRMQRVKTPASRSLVSMCSSSLAMHSAPILASKSARKLTAPLKSWSSLLSANCLPIRSRASARSRRPWLQRAAACARIWRRSPKSLTRRINPETGYLWKRFLKQNTPSECDNIVSGGFFLFIIYSF